MNKVLARLEPLGIKLVAILARMNQPSSWAAYAAVAGALGVSQVQYARFSLIAAAICGVIATIRDDNSGTSPANPEQSQ